MKKRGNLKITLRLTLLTKKSNFFVILGMLLGFIGELTSIAMVGLGAAAIIKFLGYVMNLDYTTIFVLVTSISMIRALLKFFEQYVDKFIAAQYITKIRSQLFKKMESLAPSILENKNYGELITTLTTDVNNIELFYSEIVSPIGVAILVAGAMSLYVLLVHGILLAIIAAISFFIIGFVIPVSIQNTVKKQAYLYQDTLAEFNDYYLDSIRGCKDIIVSKGETIRKKEISIKSEKLSIASQKLNLRNSMVDAITTGFAFLFIFIFILAAAFIVQEDGNQLLLAITIVCYYMSLKPAIKLNTLTTAFSSMVASGNRILDIIDEKPTNPNITKGVDFDFEFVELNRVAFSYNNTNETLKRVNLKVKKGDIVAIIGASGTGKTTIFKLLMQNYFPTSGEVLYNEIDIKQINTTSIYKNVSIFSQHTHLFQDTVRNNLLVAKPNATNKEIMDACKKANVHNAILALPRGYNTIVGEAGNSGLSLGEVQRIGLARVFLSQPKLLLLDEPTSNIDAINENIIMSSLINNSQDMGIIMISHRASTVAYAKTVYRLKNGLLVLEK